MRNFENKNATKTEQEMFCYAGLYVVEDNANYTKYVVVHPEKHDRFYDTISVNENDIDWGEFIIFWHMSEEIGITGRFDAKIIDLISKRTKELNYT